MKNINNCNLDELEILAEPVYSLLNCDELKSAIDSNNLIKVGTTALKLRESECNVILNTLGADEKSSDLDRVMGIATTILGVFSNKIMLDFFTSVNPKKEEK